jgi:hypothetical protein
MLAQARRLFPEPLTNRLGHENDQPIGDDATLGLPLLVPQRSCPEHGAALGLRSVWLSSLIAGVLLRVASGHSARHGPR